MVTLRQCVGFQSFKWEEHNVSTLSPTLPPFSYPTIIIPTAHQVLYNILCSHQLNYLICHSHFTDTEMLSDLFKSKMLGIGRPKNPVQVSLGPSIPNTSTTRQAACFLGGNSWACSFLSHSLGSRLGESGVCESLSHSYSPCPWREGSKLQFQSTVMIPWLGLTD